MPFTLSFARDLAAEPEAVFAAWTDPARRARFETPPGSGLRAEAMGLREGAFEVIAIERDGAKVGEIETFAALVVPPAEGAAGLLLAQGRTTLSGRTHLLTQTTLAIVPGAGGARLTATCQIVSPTGTPAEGEMRAEWEGRLDRFEAVLEETAT